MDAVERSHAARGRLHRCTGLVPVCACNPGRARHAGWCVADRLARRDEACPHADLEYHQVVTRRWLGRFAEHHCASADRAAASTLPVRLLHVDAWLSSTWCSGACRWRLRSSRRVRPRPLPWAQRWTTTPSRASAGPSRRPSDSPPAPGEVREQQAGARGHSPSCWPAVPLCSARANPPTIHRTGAANEQAQQRPRRTP